MNLNIDVNVSQQQKLALTQNMQMSLKILQLPAVELSKYISNEIMENPILKADYNEDSEKIDYQKQENYNGKQAEDNDVNPLNFVSKEKLLKEYLFEQIELFSLDKHLMKVCRYIIENIDERGYLPDCIENIADEIHISHKIAIAALKVIQSLDPAGIGARDLKECIRIQLNRKGYNDKILFTIVDNYIEFIAENKYKLLSKKLNISIIDVQSYADIIKHLEPKPSRGYYTGEETNYVTPDAYITKVNNQDYIIMNDEMIPKLTIDSEYTHSLENCNDKLACEFMKKKLDNAVFLINSIEHRKSTIYKIIDQIIKIQKNYFDNKESSLKPMTLKEIAQDINMSESTVSRAVKDKYISTNKGVIALKDFFTGGFSSAEGNDISQKTILKKIKEIIDSEDKSDPLSDDKISKILSDNEKINVSRRTVAKYREQLGINSSNKRKIY